MTKDGAAAARLFDVANSDDVVIDSLEGLVRRMKASREAKAALAGLPTADLREVLLHRAKRRAER